MEHELSAFYDITHGEGLAILTPHWMDFALSEATAAKFAAYGRAVFDITETEDWKAAKAAIAETRAFFRTMQLPETLREVGICEETHFEEMAEKAAAGCVGCYVPLTKEDIIGIFRAAL